MAWVPSVRISPLVQLLRQVVDGAVDQAGCLVLRDGLFQHPAGGVDGDVDGQVVNFLHAWASAWAMRSSAMFAPGQGHFQVAGRLFGQPFGLGAGVGEDVLGLAASASRCLRW